ARTNLLKIILLLSEQSLGHTVQSAKRVQIFHFPFQHKLCLTTHFIAIAAMALELKLPNRQANIHTCSLINRYKRDCNALYNLTGFLTRLITVNEAVNARKKFRE
ncbi:hypothetical protein Tcan_00565, partial [Toxocara canis]